MLTIVAISDIIIISINRYNADSTKATNEFAEFLQILEFSFGIKNVTIMAIRNDICQKCYWCPGNDIINLD